MRVNGTYVSVDYDSLSNLSLTIFCSTNLIKFDYTNFHTTVLYSSDIVEIDDYQDLGICIPDKFEIWDTNSSNKKCLVLKLKANKLVEIHKDILTRTGAKHSFPDYTPHVTLCYDVGDNFDVESLKVPKFILQPTKLKIDDLKL